MARMRIQGLDGLEEGLRQLAEPTRMAIKAVDAAAPILAVSLRSEIAKAADRGYATGELAMSVTATKAKENAYGVYSLVGPTGTDARGTRNAEKLAYLEYGTSRVQRRHPVRQKAINRAEAQCRAAMENAVYEAADRLWQ